jgi:hypothetical protein
MLTFADCQLSGTLFGGYIVKLRIYKGKENTREFLQYVRVHVYKDSWAMMPD